MYSTKEVFLKISQNSQEDIYTGIYSLMKLEAFKKNLCSIFHFVQKNENIKHRAKENKQTNKKATTAATNCGNSGDFLCNILHKIFS